MRGVVGEQQIARAAGAQQLPGLQVDHVPVRRIDGDRTHLATLGTRGRRTVADHPAQRGEGVVHDDGRMYNDDTGINGFAVSTTIDVISGATDEMSCSMSLGLCWARNRHTPSSVTSISETPVPCSASSIRV